MQLRWQRDGQVFVNRKIAMQAPFIACTHDKGRVHP